MWMAYTNLKVDSARVDKKEKDPNYVLFTRHLLQL